MPCNFKALPTTLRAILYTQGSMSQFRHTLESMLKTHSAKISLLSSGGLLAMSLPEANETILAMTSLGANFSPLRKARSIDLSEPSCPNLSSFHSCNTTWPRTGDPGTLQENQTLQIQRST